MKRYIGGRSRVPYVKTTVRIYGERQIAAFEAMCAINSRRPHELAADVVLDAIKEAQGDPGFQQVTQALRRLHSPLRLVRRSP